MESRARRVLVKLSSGRDGAKKQRGNQAGRAGQVVLICAQPLALSRRNGEAVLDQDRGPQPLCAKGHGCDSHTYGHYEFIFTDTAIKEVKRYHNRDT